MTSGRPVGSSEGAASVGVSLIGVPSVNLKCQFQLRLSPKTSASDDRRILALKVTGRHLCLSCVSLQPSAILERELWIAVGVLGLNQTERFAKTSGLHPPRRFANRCELLLPALGDVELNVVLVA